jgi:hypothetical protein
VSDTFPSDGTENLDTDGDGIGNNADTDDLIWKMIFRWMPKLLAMLMMVLMLLMMPFLPMPLSQLIVMMMAWVTKRIPMMMRGDVIDDRNNEYFDR